METPTLWTEGEGRWADAEITEVAFVDSWGSRVGMYSKIDCPVLETRFGRWGGPEVNLPFDFVSVLETRFGRWGGHRLLRIRKRKRSGLRRESEGFIVPTEIAGQHNPGRGREPCFVHATEARRIRGLPCR